jgi:MFS transporter, MHS family, proline/betaine transporter
MGIFSSLSYEQREAATILQIGTFLEYFDLMLYVHMAVVLNDLFFPKTDPHVARLIAAMSFCLTFVFRPFGALLFGYIGDTVGRKSTIIITTMMMAVCSATMAMLPTYAQIGITAAWLVTICRIVQGLSSMGEIIGAQIYLTELIKIPERYPVVTFIGCADMLGGFAALALAAGVLALGMEWRAAFWIGALIAIVGTVARTALRETPEFVNAKHQLKKNLEKANVVDSNLVLKDDLIVNRKVNQKTSLAYFFIHCARPVWFYFVYVHCALILKHSFNYSSKQVIQHNLILAIIEFVITLFYAHLSYRIYPLKIVNVRVLVSFVFVMFVPYLFSNVTTAIQLLFIQGFLCIFKPTQGPAAAVFIPHFPVFKRFKYVSFLYALARAVMYVITSFGLVYLTEKFGHWGLLIVLVPVLIGVKYGIYHFEGLEKAVGNYPQSSSSPNLIRDVV